MPARPATAPTFQYRAPDGTGFNDRAAYRRYMFETCFTFKNKSGEKLMKLPGEIDGYAMGAGCLARVVCRADLLLM